MIKYSLACDQAHTFESWFPSSDAYDEQAGRGLVTCPACGSGQVGKRVMAPSVARTDRSPAQPPGAPAPSPAGAPALPVPAAPAPVALLSERDQAIRTMLREIREHVTKTAEHVGPRFADEARRIHHGEAQERSIYGEAAPEEARALLEEGIAILPVPVLPEDRH